MKNDSPTAISLFSSGGIGDLAIREAGFEILVSNEILDDRHAVFRKNFPNTTPISGDVWRSIDAIESETLERLSGRRLTLLYATPPCQGMSKNGRGKLLNAIRAGSKPALDERNRLILPVLELARRLKPEIVLFENVSEMASTIVLDNNGVASLIPDLIQQQLGREYTGQAEVIEFADYGVPQRRKRLITVFSRHASLINWFDQHKTFIPPPTHTRKGIEGTLPWLTIRNTIGHLPPLDAKDEKSAKSDTPFHRVPLLDSMKYWWVENTPQGRGAFDNQCVRCGFQGNATHAAKRDPTGINRASLDTPLHCTKCGELLPRPSVLRDNKRALMRGFTSAYKRMSYDYPASALTRNLSYACSDNKLHPEQNRVLSLFEAFKIHTIDQYSYVWERQDGKRVSDKTIREIIGESIPPAGLQVLIDHLLVIRRGDRAKLPVTAPLFA